MLLIPDALLLDAGVKEEEPKEGFMKVCQAMLKHCGNDMKSRVALLDVYDGHKKDTNEYPVITAFRDTVQDNLDFGIAYYPWVHTSVIEATEVNYLNFSSPASDAEGGDGENAADKSLEALRKILTAELVDVMVAKKDEEPEDFEKRKKVFQDEIDKLMPYEGDIDKDKKIQTAHQTMFEVSGVYKDLMKEVREHRNLMPVTPAMAGVYTMVDNSRGVWKAPANVGLNSVIVPAVSITSEEQEDLNVTLTGKSVNAIRSFVGEGVKVWGARTLDGNSQDWRYVNVRRTLIFIEQSVKAAAKAYVFEPNDSNTWILMKGMLNNFLTNLWKQGALAGATPGEAFSVSVGLGSTMTSNDILDGIMRISVKVAITKPAEFIVITFQQKMQES